MYMYVSVYRYVPVCAGASWSPEESVGSLELKLQVVGFEPPNMVAGNWTLVFCKSTKSSWLLIYLQLLRLEFLIDVVYLDICFSSFQIFGRIPDLIFVMDF